MGPYGSFDKMYYFFTALKCKAYDPPINGLISCLTQAAYGGDVCTVSCNSEKEFSRIPAQSYICLSATAAWVSFDPRPYVSREIPWPDCTGTVYDS